MFSKVFSAQTNNLKAQIIDVEVDFSSGGLHAFDVVGLPDKAVEESRDRVASAVKNHGFNSPKERQQKVIVALAPADLKKEGPIFDLAIALAYLLAAEEIKFDPAGKLFLGELSLDGKLRPIDGVLPLVREAQAKGFTEIYLPKENAKEAALIGDIEIYGAYNFGEILDHLGARLKQKRGSELTPLKKILAQPKTEVPISTLELEIDFDDVVGQESAKRGLQIAAAGGHNLAMYGPPGTGKTMLAKAFCGILPPLSFEEVLDVTAIHSICGVLENDLIFAPPFRSPHHTSSYVSLVGGGATPKPGEITLAHKGVLFLDEFPEFDRRVIETLRQPLEDRIVNVSRAKGSVRFPAHFILIAAMNPCPCGNFGVENKVCICPPLKVQQYQRKISGPIMDRIDLWVEVAKIEHEKLSGRKKSTGTVNKIREQIKAAREIQAKRFAGHHRKIKTNSEMNARDLGELVNLAPAIKTILDQSAERLDLSARAYHRIIKLARTIADLENSKEISENHLLEALQYRPKRLVV